MRQCEQPPQFPVGNVRIYLNRLADRPFVMALCPCCGTEVVFDLDDWTKGVAVYCLSGGTPVANVLPTPDAPV